jgi:hypothetical protein
LDSSGAHYSVIDCFHLYNDPKLLQRHANFNVLKPVERQVYKGWEALSSSQVQAPQSTRVVAAMTFFIPMASGLKYQGNSTPGAENFL